VRRPERALLDRFIDTGAVKLINIAPETSPEAVDLIAHAASRGVVVGAGHAKPHAERLREAADAGLRYVIHLGNGPTGSSLKAFHDGGMLEESLRNDKLTVTIILDGVHVHPQLVRDWIARKEASRVIAVSDCAFAGDAPPAEFQAFGTRGALSEDRRYLSVVSPPTGASGGHAAPGAQEPIQLSSDFSPLFGSAVGMREVFEMAINILTREMPGVYHRLHPALSLEEACLEASRMTSANPAALLGLRDRGALREGLRADLVLVDLQGSPGSYTVTVRGTFLAGPGLPRR
jgi:N-acetylglucosamine-6-phosphate deacetylase